jgi:hypothetical protein
MSDQPNIEPADRLLRWLPAIVVAALAALLCVAAAYVWNFGRLGLSPSQDHWGQFGDFVGGVSNPVLSFLALVALVLTVALQSKQLGLANAQLRISKEELVDSRKELELSRRAAEGQLSHFQKEAKKNDIYRTIRVLEERLETLYSEPVYLLLGDKLECWQLYLLLSHGSDSLLTKVPPLLAEPPQQYHSEIMRTKGTLTRLHITLVKFSMLLTSLATVDDSDELMVFYEPTLAHLARQLKKTGYLPEEDEQSIQHMMQFRNSVKEGRRRAA